MMLTVEEVLEQLIGFDTTSRHSNLALIEYVDELFSRYGIQSTLLENEDKTKANLYASIGPAIPGGVMLSGHTDVVPVDGQPWTCLLYTSPSPRDLSTSRMPSSA